MPHSEPDSYVVYPTGYDDCESDEKIRWCLTVKNGHAFGWSVRRSGWADERQAMNRKGEFIYEQRGHKQNESRRYSLEEALALAEKHVDKQRLQSMTFAEFAAWYETAKDRP